MNNKVRILFLVAGLIVSFVIWQDVRPQVQGGTPLPLHYVAKLTQTGTNAPTALVIENTLGSPVTWERAAVGDYLGDINEHFPEESRVGLQVSAWSGGTFTDILWSPTLDGNKIEYNTEQPNLDDQIPAQRADGKIVYVTITVYPPP